MPPPRRPRTKISHDIQPCEWLFLIDELTMETADDPVDWWSLTYDQGRLFREDRPTIGRMVEMWGRQALAAFEDKHGPGRKPSWWYKHR